MLRHRTLRTVYGETSQILKPHKLRSKSGAGVALPSSAAQTFHEMVEPANAARMVCVKHIESRLGF